ncbi:MAG: Gx transporter family protein [Tissierellia bacterium]|nr:Gx transporter family protein [Tissierellia bacterium]
MQINDNKRLVLLALLSTIGATVGLLENSIPIPIPVPGARLGLSNMVVLVTLVLFGLKEGIIVSLLKSLILMLMSGNVSGFIYSFSGALFSSLAMALALKYFNQIFSLIGISIIGSTFHNIAQIGVSAIIINNIKMFIYLPFLVLIGIITGIFVGKTSELVIQKLKLTNNFRGV